MPATNDHQDRRWPPAVELLEQGLQALARQDWETLRSLCHDEIVWRIPGRSPLAGELVGPDAVVARYQFMISETASDRPAASVALFGEGDYAVLVQTNDVIESDGTVRPFTALTLARARDGRLAELQYFVSDQYAVDKLWSERLGRLDDWRPHGQQSPEGPGASLLWLLSSGHTRRPTVNLDSSQQPMR